MPVNNNMSSYFFASSPSGNVSSSDSSYFMPSGTQQQGAQRTPQQATRPSNVDSTYVQPQGAYGYSVSETTSVYLLLHAAQGKIQTSMPTQNLTKTVVYALAQDPTMQDQTRTAIYAPSQDPMKTAIYALAQDPTAAFVQLNPTTMLQQSMDRNYYEAPYSTNVEVPLSTRTAVMQALLTTAICQASAQPKGISSTESVYFGVSGTSNAKSSTPVNKAPAAASNVSVYFTAGTQGKVADTTTSVYFLPK